MIRVGFVNIFAVREWLGGLNYLRNLVQAVCGLAGRRIEPVLFSGTGTDAAILAEFSFMSVVHTRVLVETAIEQAMEGRALGMTGSVDSLDAVARRGRRDRGDALRDVLGP